MPFSLIARVTTQVWNDRDDLVDLGQTDIEVADRVMKLSAAQVRTLDRDPELRESMVAGRVEHNALPHDGPIRVVLDAENVAEALGAAMGRRRFTTEQLTDTHLRRMRRLLAADLRATAHKQATVESELRLRGALAALRDLTNGELNAAIRQERSRRQARARKRADCTVKAIASRQDSDTETNP